MTRLLPFACVALLACPAVAQRDSCTVSTTNVHEHIGATVVFCGTPSTVHAPRPGKEVGDPVYINFGGAFPLQTFKVVVSGEVAGKGRKHLVKRYRDEALRIHGVVLAEADRPIMYLQDMKDLEVE